MAKTIDLTSAVINIHPTGKVNMGSAMGGGGNKKIGADFKVTSGLFEGKNGKQFSMALVSIKNIDNGIKQINNTLKDRMKADTAYRKAEQRRLKEERIERARNIAGKAVGGIGKVGKEAAGGLKSLLSSLGILGGIANIAGAFLSFAALRKLTQSNFVGTVMKGFMTGIKAIMDAVSAIPTRVLNGMGRIIGTTFKVLGTITAWGIKFFSSALGKIFNDQGKLNLNLKGLSGVLQLIAGVGAIKIGSRLLRNPRGFASDIRNIFDTLGNVRRHGIKGLFMGGRGGRAGRDLGTRANPMHVYVVNQGGGLGDMLGGGRGRGLSIGRRFASQTGRGGGLARSSGLFRAPGASSGVNRMGSVIKPGSVTARNPAGQAVRMLGADRASNVMGNMRASGVSRMNRAAVLTGSLSEGQAVKIAQEGGGGLVQGAKGLAARGGNLTRGVGSNIAGKAKGVGGFLGNIWGGLKGAFGNLVKMLQGLNPMALFGKIKEGVLGKADDLMKKAPELKKLKGLKNMKNPGKLIKSLVVGAGKKAKPALKMIKNARKTFRVPGLDALIGALTAAIEIGLGASPGNAILGALGGVLGTAAGTAIGSAALPGPGSFIGAMAGGIGGEILGRQLARGIGGMLPVNIRDMDVFGTGAPLFATEGNGYGRAEEGAAGMQRGGQVYGGRPHGDSIPAYLERGEYVLNRKAVKEIGPRNLNAINFQQIPRFAEGGGVGSTAKSGFIGTDHESNRFKTAGTGKEAYFLQVDKGDPGRIEIWNEEWGSDKYVGALKSGALEWNNAWWGGARKDEKSSFAKPDVKKMVEGKAIDLVRKAGQDGDVSPSEANKILKAIPGGASQLLVDTSASSAVGGSTMENVLAQAGVSKEAKVKALTDMIMNNVSGGTSPQTVSNSGSTNVPSAEVDSSNMSQSGEANTTASAVSNNIVNQVSTINQGLVYR